MSSEEKKYIRVDLNAHSEVFSDGVLNIDGTDYDISKSILEDISNTFGVSRKLHRTLSQNNPSILRDLVTSMSNHYNDGFVSFLVEDSSILATYGGNKTPLLKDSFYSTVCSIFEDYSNELSVEELVSEGLVSRVLVFREEEYEHQGWSYKLGIILQNDELGHVSCNMVVSVSDLVFYLPKKYMNLSSSRYLKSSANTKEALEQLLLKVVEKMLSDDWFSIVPEITYCLIACKNTPITYEEYVNVNRDISLTAQRSGMEAEENMDLIENLRATFIDFNRNYHISDKNKSNYIWRCSALSDKSIYDLITYTDSLTKEHFFYPIYVDNIRFLLGEFIMLPRISENLAKRIKGSDAECD